MFVVSCLLGYTNTNDFYPTFIDVFALKGQLNHGASFINPYAAGGQFCQYKMMQKSWKMTKTLTHGYSSESTQRELSNEYQHNRV